MLPFIFKKKPPVYITKETLMRFEPQKIHLSNEHYHSGRYHCANQLFM